MNATEKNISKKGLIVGITKDTREKIKIDVKLLNKENSTKKSWIDLKEVRNPLCLSISADIGNSGGGQCYDTIAEYIKHNNIDFKNNWNAEKLNRLVDIWKCYHLNDMEAATLRQYELFNKYENTPEFLVVFNYKKKEAEAKGEHFWDSYEKRKLLLNIYDRVNIEKAEELRQQLKMLQTLNETYKNPLFINDEHTSDKENDISALVKLTSNTIASDATKYQSNKYHDDKPKGRRTYIQGRYKRALNAKMEEIKTELQKPEYYSYGDLWLFREISADVIKELTSLINGAKDDEVLQGLIIDEDFTSKLQHDIKKVICR